jgi:glutathione S-transferase
MWESNAILIYLAQTRGALLPADKQQLARALQWLSWQATELNPPWMYALNALVRKRPGFDDPAKIAESISAWTSRMEMLEAELAKGNAFIAGDSFSVADIALGLSIHRWFIVPFERKSLPHVTAYYERLKQRPAGARWMPDDIV